MIFNFASVLLAAVVSISEPTQPDLSQPRDLPALHTRWTFNAHVVSVKLDEDTAYVLSLDRMSALDVATGKTLWERPLNHENGPIGLVGLVVSGQHVIVPGATNLFVLDRKTGAIEHEVNVDGSVQTIAGPPLVALVVDSDMRGDLVSIDAASGAFLARQPLGTGMHELRIEKGVALVASTRWGEAENGATFAAFHPDTLQVLWQRELPASSDFEKVGGDLYVRVASGECGVEGERYSLDLGNGKLGSQPLRREPGETGRGLDWELQTVWVRADEAASRLRRNSPATGESLWSLELPCAPKAWARDGDTLFLDCRPKHGRGVLLILDWKTGSIRHAAFGLRDATALHVSGDLVLATTSKGLVAVSTREFDPPESSRPVGDAVRSLLAEQAPESEHNSLAMGEAGALIDELKAVGPDALPVLADEARTAQGVALAVTAKVLGDASFRPAAANLRQRIGEPGSPALLFPGMIDPQVEILRALSRIGDGNDVPKLAEILADSKRPASLRHQALAALATLGTPEAARAIEKTLGARDHRRRVAWRPPAPPPEVASALSEEQMTEAFLSGDTAAVFGSWRPFESGRMTLPDGRSLVVFADGSLGRLDDLWMSEIGLDGSAGRSWFLGVSGFDGAELSVREDQKLSVQLEEGALVITALSPTPFRVVLADIRRDSDGDGLTDLVEKRLKTDPNRSDTDGDDLKDSEDPAPNAARRPRGEKEEIAAAIFEQFFLLDRTASRMEVGYVVGGPALEWFGRSSPTITVTEEEIRAPERQSAFPIVPQISIRPGFIEDFEAHGTSVGRGERAYLFQLTRIGFPEEYEVVVGRLGQRWVIRSIQLRSMEETTHID